MTARAGRVVFKALAFMNKWKLALLCCTVLTLVGACRNAGRNQTGRGRISVVGMKADSARFERLDIKYAGGFSLTYDDGVCLVDIQDPQKEESQSFHYALVRRGSTHPALPKDYTVIEVPVRRVICMTSLQLSNFIKLGATDAVAGITSTRHLFNEEMNRRIADGRTHKIGIEGNFDNEVIMGVNPDLILISPFKRGGYSALKDVDITLVPHLGYKETTPLGQAEWVKFIGLLLGMETDAENVFDEIEKRYTELASLAKNANGRPVVFSGEIQGGNWYAVGGNSFLANIFRDAGADYFLKDDNHSGGVTLDYEVVYSQAANADYWRIVNSYNGDFSYGALMDEDARYADFKAFKDKGVIYCNMSRKPFYESMPMEPELVLSDFIKVFHPELLPDYQPVYYELLK